MFFTEKAAPIVASYFVFWKIDGAPVLAPKSIDGNEGIKDLFFSLKTFLVVKLDLFNPWLCSVAGCIVDKWVTECIDELN